jgi:serine/threonine protein kinase
VAAEREIIEHVARLIAPVGADVRHLCAVGVGTFSVEMPAAWGREGVVYALKVVEEVQPCASRSATEFEALVRIDNPHVVRYRDTGTYGHDMRDYRWLAMDLVDGTSLADLLAEGAVFDLPTAVRLLREAVAGATALWNVGTTHRDIGADNLLITPTGEAVIVDLGLAETNATPSRETSRDWRADQYALGRVGYWLVTGSEPFRDDSRAVQAEAQPARLAHEVSRAVPRDLSHVLAMMLAPRSKDRYSRPNDLAADLAKIARLIVPAEPGPDSRPNPMPKPTPAPMQSPGQVCRR